MTHGTTGKFGEGTSGRLRRMQKVRNSISESLPEIFDSKLWDQIVLNPYSRSIHVALLSRRSTRYLLGVDEGLEHSHPLPTTEEVVEQWIQRWLRPALLGLSSPAPQDLARGFDMGVLPRFEGLWNGREKRDRSAD